MRGFTLVELILVVAILAVVAALSVPFAQSFQTSSDYYTNVYDISATLRRAQQQAILGLQNDSWGVMFDDSSKQYVLFKGDDFATRDQEYDQIETYPEIFSLSTTFSDEIIFLKGSGTASASGTVQFIGPTNVTQASSVGINSIGKIELLN